MLHLLYSVVPQPLLRLELQDTVDEVFHFITEMWILPDPLLFGHLHHSLYFEFLLDVRCGEGRVVVRHLIGVDSYRPDVDLLLVPFFEHHFRGVVDSRPSLSLTQLILMDLFCQSEISKLGITVFKDQYIFRFQISVHNVFGVQIFHAQDEAGQNKPHCVFSCLLEVAESGRGFVDEGISISSWSPLHHEVQIEVISEGVV